MPGTVLTDRINGPARDTTQTDGRAIAAANSSRRRGRREALSVWALRAPTSLIEGRSRIRSAVHSRLLMFRTSTPARRHWSTGTARDRHRQHRQVAAAEKQPSIAAATRATSSPSAAPPWQAATTPAALSRALTSGVAMPEANRDPRRKHTRAPRIEHGRSAAATRRPSRPAPRGPSPRDVTAAHGEKSRGGVVGAGDVVDKNASNCAALSPVIRRRPLTPQRRLKKYDPCTDAEAERGMWRKWRRRRASLPAPRLVSKIR